MKYTDFANTVIELAEDYEEKEQIIKDDERLRIVEEYLNQSFDRWDEDDLYFYIKGVYGLVMTLEDIFISYKEREKYIQDLQYFLFHP